MSRLEKNIFDGKLIFLISDRFDISDRSDRSDWSDRSDRSDRSDSCKGRKTKKVENRVFCKIIF